MSEKKYSGESDAYRQIREELLDAEIALKSQVGRVAELRRKLPLNPVEREYVFREGPADLEQDEPLRETRLAELFDEGRDDLIVVHFMFEQSWEKGCPMCTMWAHGYDAIADSIRQNASFVVVAKQEIGKLRAWARERGWRNLRLLSAHDNDFIRDFGMEGDRGQQPGISVFRRQSDGSVRHFYTVDASMRPGHWNGMDLLTPVWSLLDLLPDGRPDWMPGH